MRWSHCGKSRAASAALVVCVRCGGPCAQGAVAHISITSMFNPGYSYVMLFVAMTLVLVLRPYGLLGTAGRE